MNKGLLSFTCISYNKMIKNRILITNYTVLLYQVRV